MLTWAKGADMKKAREEIFVGIDVSKAWLDVAVHEQEETIRSRTMMIQVLPAW